MAEVDEKVFLLHNNNGRYGGEAHNANNNVDERCELPVAIQTVVHTDIPQLRLPPKHSCYKRYATTTSYL